MKRHLPPLKSLLALESVVRSGSVTAAANELSVTHSAISKQLSSLEEWLGVPLFAERRRGMVPTAVSLRLAEAARAAFDQLQVAIDAAQPGAQAQVVPLRVIAPSTFAMRWLIPQLPGFRSPPGQQIDITVRSTHTEENWLDIPFDVAIRRGGLIPAQFRSVPLFAEELSLVASTHLPSPLSPGLGKRSRWGAQEWLETVGLVEATTRPGELQSWLRSARLPETMADSALRFPHFYVAMEAMLQGKGAVVAPTFILEELLVQGQVTEPWPEIRLVGPMYRIVIDPIAPAVDASEFFAAWLNSLPPHQLAQLQLVSQHEGERQ